ncbi:hypothetical protein AYO21_04670 [Fonsecaea monophora]|uniref:Uncharacterized protein n=2 Tax=Fonsecaea TaxID=40354 RepID=A0A0D2DRV5_9EURO|nr:uncharacterized protein Z517_07222 [Fonsecaea pedrosoi CBS 271.37]XP_022513009.1 hypothetical protein AYO21_04670 [Fonsecaea monophora]KAH0839074.1 hypothetical protein FOPE_05571 [Fonsecaea pedrosoi]KIW80606.1 hypothetical protein Z517_07222 [Fonsecaea pedrosoi CBS 271.37]OAG41057.1 hypothetical protein AYO21_04670 [Fonsecaea monophora]
MGLNNHYRSVSDNDESFPLSEKSQPRAGWGKQSICLSIATGTLFIAIIVAIFSLISSVFVSNTNTTKSDALSASTTSAAAVAASTSAVAVTPPVDDSIKSAEGSDGSTQKAEIDHCGFSPEEARERGCIFDVMMQLWTPAACFDETLSNRFLEVGNWTWYADPSASHIYTLEEMRKGEHDAVYVAQDYHVTHCIYAWEKLVRSMRNQQPLITELISYDHVIHCRHKTLQRADGGDSIRGVRAPTGYTQCAPYDTWKDHLPPNEHSSTD